MSVEKYYVLRAVKNNTYIKSYNFFQKEHAQKDLIRMNKNYYDDPIKYCKFYIEIVK